MGWFKKVTRAVAAPVKAAVKPVQQVVNSPAFGKVAQVAGGVVAVTTAGALLPAAGLARIAVPKTSFGRFSGKLIRNQVAGVAANVAIGAAGGTAIATAGGDLDVRAIPDLAKKAAVKFGITEPAIPGKTIPPLGGQVPAGAPKPAWGARLKSALLGPLFK